jgi:hypothetical protein
VDTTAAAAAGGHVYGVGDDGAIQAKNTITNIATNDEYYDDSSKNNRAIILPYADDKAMNTLGDKASITST